MNRKSRRTDNRYHTTLHDRLDRTLAEARAIRAEISEAADRRKRRAIEELIGRRGVGVEGESAAGANFTGE